MSDDGPDERDQFLLDAMLGTLATYLRMCGHDAAFALDREIEADEAIASLAEREGRRIVTRDRQLAARVEDAILLTERDVEAQLRELVDGGIDLELPETPVHCGTCNGRLSRVPTESTTPSGVPDPREVGVWQCEECGQHFWKGSHWDDVRARVESVRRESRSTK